jgi:type IV pilus assembly protein PilB
MTKLVRVGDQEKPSSEGTSVPEPSGLPGSEARRQPVDIREELRPLSETVPPPVLVALILERALDARATDIHIDPKEEGVRIRFRVDGQLQDVLSLESELALLVVSRLKVMAEVNIVDRRLPQDGGFSIPHFDTTRDLRLATFPTLHGEKIVIRVHDTLVEMDSFEDLGMSPEQAEQMESLILRPFGAILVAGAVGSGKTTTLYRCLTKVNVPTRNIMTIEDPIESHIVGINQAQISAEMGFGDGLKAMLRQDPDIIMIGEIRDEETAQIGLRAAGTGVLLFSSLHAADTVSAIGNMYNFGIPGYQLSNCLIAIVSQRLIRKICPYCRTSYRADPKVLAQLELDPWENRDMVLYRGRGCPACFQTGYLGRTGIFEIMEVDEELHDLIFQQTPKDVLRNSAIEMGIQTLEQSAFEKIVDGTTTVEEALRVVST